MDGFLFWSNVKVKENEKFTLTDDTYIGKFLEKVCVKCEFSILGKSSVHFPGGGITLVFVIAESHVAYHSFAEENNFRLEISSCGKKIDKLRIVEIIFDFFEIEKIDYGMYRWNDGAII